MLGPRVGIGVGPKLGEAVGPAASETGTAGAGDGPNGWLTPTTNAALSLLGIPNAAALHGFQETSGAIVDLSGGGLDLAASGTVGYQATVAGWTRKAATVATGAGNRFGRTAAQVPLPSASFLWIGYVAVATTASVRSILVGSDSAAATELAVRKTATDVPSIKVAAVAANGASSIVPGAHVIALLWDVTNLRVCAYTELEKRTGTYDPTVADGNKGWGAGVNVAGDLSILWDALWTGASAELSDAQVKARLQLLNITIPWS